MEAIHIRRATPADAAQIIAGINSVCAEGEAFYTTQFVPTCQWEMALYEPTSTPDLMLAVAEWQNVFAGAVQIFPGGNDTIFRHVGELGIFALPAYRGLGIGTRLLAWAMEWAKRTDLEKITLSVFSSNRGAYALYKQFGFLEEGRRVRQFKVGTSYADEILMARFLSPIESGRLT